VIDNNNLPAGDGINVSLVRRPDQKIIVVNDTLLKEQLKCESLEINNKCNVLIEAEKTFLKNKSWLVSHGLILSSIITHYFSPPETLWGLDSEDFQVAVGVLGVVFSVFFVIYAIKVTYYFWRNKNTPKKINIDLNKTLYVNVSTNNTTETIRGTAT